MTTKAEGWTDLIVALLESAWRELPSEHRLTLTSVILSTIVTPEDTARWRRSVEDGGPAGIDGDLVAYVRHLQETCAMARSIVMAIDVKIESLTAEVLAAAERHANGEDVES